MSRFFRPAGVVSRYDIRPEHGRFLDATDIMTGIVVSGVPVANSFNEFQFENTDKEKSRDAVYIGFP